VMGVVGPMRPIGSAADHREMKLPKAHWQAPLIGRGKSGRCISACADLGEAHAPPLEDTSISLTARKVTRTAVDQSIAACAPAARPGREIANPVEARKQGGTDFWDQALAFDMRAHRG